MIQSALDVFTALHPDRHELIAAGLACLVAFLIGRAWPRGSGDQCSASMFDNVNSADHRSTVAYQGLST